MKKKLRYLWFWLTCRCWYINLPGQKQLVIGTNRVDWHDLFKYYNERDRLGAHLGRFYFVVLDMAK